MRTIKIDHIGKTEGHLGFEGALGSGDMSSARILTQEGARLIEGIVLNRRYSDVPIITSRICGVCPIVHNLGAILALEMALNIEPTKEITLLRKIFNLAQIIHSHALHVFFLSFPDFIGISNDFDLVKKYPAEAVAALHFRDWALKLCDTIGGRATHPINSVVGGFNVPPSSEELQVALNGIEPVIDQALLVVDFVKRKARVPKFTNPTNYVTLKKNKEYAHLDGDLFLSDTLERVKVKDFIYNFTELSLPYEAVKRVEHDGQTYFVGALARLNNNFDDLNPVAKSIWEKLKVDRPCYNSFYNLQAQAVEIVHAFEEIQKLLTQYLKIKNPKLRVDFTVNPGRGASIIEAPRGILFHYYELNKDGIVTHSNIVTPTAQFLANLEFDLKEFLPTIAKYDEAKQKHLIKTLIRAYDPCISCATH